MDLSLVVTTYNRALQVQRALKSLAELRLADGFEPEVLVVDNNSQDDTEARLQAVADAWPGLPLRRLFETKQGVSNARNCAASHARGKWLAFMDDDQLIAPDYLIELQHAIAAHAADIIGGRIVYQHDAPLPEWLPPLIRTVGQLDLGPDPRYLNPATELLKGGNFAIRRDSLLSLGGFNPALGRVGSVLLGGEEDELQRRLVASGGRILYWPGLVQFNMLEPQKRSKRYWRRHAYNYGITLRAMGNDTRKLPPWLLKRLLQAAAAWTRAILRTSPGGFERELEIWTCLGALRAVVKREATR